MRYRNLCLVALMTTEEEPFPDNWIYLHDPRPAAGRVQNFGAWSPDMVRPGTTCLGVEYFCFDGDDIWEMPDYEAVELATEELATIGLIDPSQGLQRGQGPRPKAYPMYDSRLPRGGRHHPRLSRALREPEDVRTQRPAPLQQPGPLDVDRHPRHAEPHRRRRHDVWSVNTRAEYLEEGPLAERLVDLDLVT